MSTGVGEIRFSTKEQGQGYSEETQVQLIKECAAEYGCSHVEYFYDRAVSAKKNKASTWGGMKQLVQYVKTKPVDYVFFAMEDRLTRQGDDFILDVWPEILYYAPDVKLINATYRTEVNPLSLEGVLKFASGIDENEKKAQRVAQSQKDILKDGKLPGHRAKFGFRYNAETAEMEPDEDKALIVRYMFDWAAWGHSFQTIADILNDAGIPSPEGKLWTKGSIWEIIRSKVYVGKRSWDFDPLLMIDQEQVDGFLEAISFTKLVPLHVWIRANELAGNNSRAIKMDTPYLLRDILVCSQDGSILTGTDMTPGHSKTKYKCYRCPTCKRSADIEKVHASVLPQLQEEWVAKVFFMGSDVRQWMDKLQRRIETTISSVCSQIRDVENLLGSSTDVDSPEYVVYQNKKYELAQLRKTAERVEGLRGDAAFYLTVERWRELDMTGLSQVELRRFLIEMVSSISIDLDSLETKSREYQHPVIGYKL
jgi:site-specific DNA recombinase